MDVVATATTTAREVDVTVLIDCPLGSGHEQLHLQARSTLCCFAFQEMSEFSNSVRRLKARAQLPVVQPLQLLAPAASGSGLFLSAI